MGMLFVFILLSVCAATVVRLPIVFYYTIRECQSGLPKYIWHSLSQAVESQTDCDVILISNVNEMCKDVKSPLFPQGISLVSDISIISEKSRLFMSTTSSLFGPDHLWTASALRFFLFEDYMKIYNVSVLIHVEADNLLYGRLTHGALEFLLKGYRGLAATPLTHIMMTASIFWVGNVHSLSKFNNYLLELGTNSTGGLSKYVNWLYGTYACCKAGGRYPRQNNMGLRPYAFSEMTMLSHYHYEAGGRHELSYLPIIPFGADVRKKIDIKNWNLTDYTPNGKDIEYPTGAGIWDSGSYGQNLGGTMVHGRGFAELGHFIGHGLIKGGCVVKFMCGRTFSEAAVDLNKGNLELGIKYIKNLDSSIVFGLNVTDIIQESKICRSGPYVKCHNEKHMPLWNLHVHSKKTSVFRSTICLCRDLSEMPYEIPYEM